MKHFKKEIIITVLFLLITGSFVSYFFQAIKWEKRNTQFDSYALIPPSPHALLHVETSNIWLQHIATSKNRRSLFERYIPVLYLQLFQQVPSRHILFSFHPEGVICYVPATPQEAHRLRNGLTQLLDSYPAHKQQKGDTNLYYYADKKNIFAGCFYTAGNWVSSYSKVLLEKVLAQAANFTDTIPKQESMHLERHSPLQLSIPAEQFPIQIIQHDTILWKNDQKWIHADLQASSEQLSLFFDFPFTLPVNSLNAAIADTLRLRFCRLLCLPIDSISAQSGSDEKSIYVTLAYPIH